MAVIYFVLFISKFRLRGGNGCLGSVVQDSVETLCVSYHHYVLKRWRKLIRCARKQNRPFVDGRTASDTEKH